LHFALGRLAGHSAGRLALSSVSADGGACLVGGGAQGRTEDAGDANTRGLTACRRPLRGGIQGLASENALGSFSCWWRSNYHRCTPSRWIAPLKSFFSPFATRREEWQDS